MMALFSRSEAIGGDGTDFRWVEAEWFQLTYELLRIAPEGDTLASWCSERDCWVTADDSQVWSDIVLSVAS